ncbi:caspase family protein [Aestuariispira insulae]|uniref:Caspase domain-containing protein n=1 Tax=Aestuariispira insulae TaxID=1461337 RepID=A0A3D9HN18_9PROT|nr:caspase family protein [Aestuariispira insulae]RED50884.1 caspase domain-containing protein [Aestuariispira insulae]
MGIRRKRLAAALLASSLLVSACSSQPMDSAGQDFYRAFSARNWHQASEIYNLNQDYFSDEEEEFESTMDLVARGLNHEFVPKLEQSKKKIAKIQWPETRDRWGTVGDSLAQARALLAQYNEHEILKIERYRAYSVDRLQETLFEIESKIATSAPAHFSAFDHFGSQSFFEIYPVALDRSRFMTRHYPVLRDEVERANLVQLDRFLNNYRVGQELTGLAAEHAQGRYVEALTHRYTGGSNPDLLDSWSVLQQAQAKGIETKQEAMGRFVVVEIPSRPRLGEPGIAFPVTLEDDMAFEIRQASLEKALQDPVGAQADYLILVDLAASATLLKKGGTSKIPSRYYSHSTYLTNPKYTAAQAEFQEAQRALQQANANRSRRSGQNGGFGTGSADAWAAVIGEILTTAAGSSEVAAAEERLERAQEELNRIPPQIEHKQYQEYHVSRVSFSGSKSYQFNYYVLDRKSGKYVRGSLNRTLEQDFVRLEGLKPSDPYAEKLQEGTVDEDYLQRWRDKAVTVKMSDIVEDYKLRRSRAGRLPVLAMVQQDLYDQRNMSLRQSRERKVAATRRPDDKFGVSQEAGDKARPITGEITEVGFGRVADYKFPEGRTNSNAFAIVIGVRNYDDRDIPPVDYALNDADAVRQYLIKTRGFPAENIVMLENPTQSALMAQFGSENNHKGKLYDTVREEGIREVFVFFSGHGIPREGGTGVLMPRDGDPLKPEFTGYGLDTLIQNLNRLPDVRVTLAVDSCFSGVSAGGSLIRQASPVFLSSQATRRGLDNGVVFTAADGSEIASWDSSVRLGLFTRHLLEGLIGKADQFGDKSGTVEVYEMDRYLREAVGKDANRRFSRRQTPQTLGDPDLTINEITDVKVTSIDQIMGLAD